MKKHLGILTGLLLGTLSINSYAEKLKDVKKSVKNPQMALVQVATEVKLNNLLSDINNAPLQPMVITEKEASFIKVRFGEFNIPEGSYVLVSNPDKSEIYRYGPKVKSPLTFNAEQGEDGIHRFSSMSITGETAVITYVPGDTVWNEKIHNIHVTSYNRGFSTDEIASTKSDDIDLSSTCGVNERRDVMCWANSNPVEFERTRPTARLLLNGSSLCTAWRVGPDNLLFTNNHCISNQSSMSSLEVWFNYQQTSCGGSQTAAITKVSGAQILQTDYTLDYTLFSVNNFDAVRGFGHYGLDVRTPSLGERIYIVQHGAGNPKELAIESDQNSDGLCRIDDAVANGRGTNSDTGYYCDTIGGSSGSAVLAANSNKVLALHHFGGCTNQGVRIDLIWPQVSSFFGGVIPVGDNGNSNAAPVADFSVSLNGLTASFNNSSSDSDGSIVSYRWDFGDDSSSTASNPTHTYAVSGTYQVTLTVTDNDGLTATKNEDVVVGNQQTPVPLVVTNISGQNQGDVAVYEYQIPDGYSALDISLSGSNGDADLYARLDGMPTYGSTGIYDCREVSTGSNESCTINNPEGGTYYIVVRTWEAFSGVTLSAEVR
ncbi:MAG: PKD domain-containing protein [Pseudomonadota bacterium]